MEVFEIQTLDKSLQRLITAFQVLGAKAFPATKYAAGKASAFILQTWVEYASGRPIPGVNATVNNIAYRNSITRERLDDFNWVVFAADDKIADRVEDGHPEIDLKKYLPFPKSRKAADGHPYSHIPFRHKRETIIKSLPKKTAQQILKMEKSYVTGSHTDSSGIKRFTYKWAQRDKQLDRELKGTRQAGIVRFETSAGKGSSSAYLTFRTISTKSPPDSWIIKAKEGVPLSTIVAKQTIVSVTQIIQKGIDEDLKVL